MNKYFAGTAQALRIAEHNNIRIYNLFLNDDYNKILNTLGKRVYEKESSRMF